uniref:Uncharacterized protein n=1 Tax=Vespula pensylvanica TaxID=30213 RepID=A0A834NQE3_VESPE|nr:hypothetical protein H0235_012144 [Vespula pensylvanica]
MGKRIEAASREKGESVRRSGRRTQSKRALIGAGTVLFTMTTTVTTINYYYFLVVGGIAFTRCLLVAFFVDQIVREDFPVDAIKKVVRDEVRRCSGLTNDWYPYEFTNCTPPQGIGNISVVRCVIDYRDERLELYSSHLYIKNESITNLFALKNFLAKRKISGRFHHAECVTCT